MRESEEAAGRGELAMKPTAERIAKGLWWDRPWKLVEGCSPVSDGCQNCWSAREAHMRSKRKNEKIRAQYEGLTTPEGRWNGQIRLMEKNVYLPLRVKKPTVWAIWNDLFHENVPDEFVWRAWWVMGQCAGFLDPSRYRPHTFLILTKRHERMQEWMRGWCDPATRERWVEKSGGAYDWMSGPKYWPDVLPNVWLGVTAENQEQANKRIPVLLQIPAAVRFVSCEPLLGPVVLRQYFTPACKHCNGTCSVPAEDGGGRPCPRCIDNLDNQGVDPSRLNWVLCGGETGPRARPMHPDWAKDLRDQCQAADVPFFFKQWGRETGRRNTDRLLDGCEWNEYPNLCGRDARKTE